MNQKLLHKNILPPKMLMPMSRAHPEIEPLYRIRFRSHSQPGNSLLVRSSQETLIFSLTTGLELRLPVKDVTKISHYLLDSFAFLCSCLRWLFDQGFTDLLCKALTDLPTNQRAPTGRPRSFTLLCGSENGWCRCMAAPAASGRKAEAGFPDGNIGKVYEKKKATQSDNCDSLLHS